MYLGLSRTQALDQLVVDQLADHNLAVERIAAAVLRFGLRRGSNRLFEGRIAAPEIASFDDGP
jgi:hypothetical protein